MQRLVLWVNSHHWVRCLLAQLRNDLRVGCIANNQGATVALTRESLNLPFDRVVNKMLAIHHIWLHSKVIRQQFRDKDVGRAFVLTISYWVLIQLQMGSVAVN